MSGVRQSLSSIFAVILFLATVTCVTPTLDAASILPRDCSGSCPGPFGQFTFLAVAMVAAGGLTKQLANAIPLNKAAAYFSPAPNISAIHRWVTQGAGQSHVETYVGQRLVTSAFTAGENPSITNLFHGVLFVGGLCRNPKSFRGMKLNMRLP